jgi:hypothetical protein
MKVWLPSATFVLPSGHKCPQNIKRAAGAQQPQCSAVPDRLLLLLLLLLLLGIYECSVVEIRHFVMSVNAITLTLVSSNLTAC